MILSKNLYQHNNNNSLNRVITTLESLGLSVESVASRIQSAGAKAVITSDEGVRGGKRIPLKVCMCECKRSKIGKCYFGELPPDDKDRKTRLCLV